MWLSFALAVGLAAPAFADYAEGMEAYRKAWAAYSQQRFDEAEQWAKRAVRTDPEQVHATALLGDLAYLSHDLKSAKGFWEEALELNPRLVSIRRQITQAEMEIELEKELEPASVGSVRVRFPSSLAPEQQERIVAELTRATEELAPFFQYRPKRPLTVLIYPREVFYGTTQLPTEVLGLFDGKIRIPDEAAPSVPVGLGRDNGAWNRVLWHEYAHALVYDLSNGRAPHWLHEGLAQEAERIAEGSTTGVKSTGVRPPSNRGQTPLPQTPLPPLRQLFGIAERPGEAVVMPTGQFYSASHRLIRFLLEAKGWDRMRVYLKGLGQGQSVEEATQAVYGWTLTALEKKWRSRLKNH